VDFDVDELPAAREYAPSRPEHVLNSATSAFVTNMFVTNLFLTNMFVILVV